MGSGRGRTFHLEPHRPGPEVGRTFRCQSLLSNWTRTGFLHTQPWFFSCHVDYLPFP